MQVITEKDLSQSKKPVQVYFEAKIVNLIQLKLKKSRTKVSMAEYIRDLVEADLKVNKRTSKKREWKSVPLGLNLSADSRKIDKIVYGL
jgi:hypothetical protein